MIALYRSGRAGGGWICHRCHREFVSGSHPLVAFARVQAHAVRERGWFATKVRGWQLIWRGDR